MNACFVVVSFIRTIVEFNRSSSLVPYCIVPVDGFVVSHMTVAPVSVVAMLMADICGRSPDASTIL